MNAKRSICYVPSGEMLRFHPVSHWIRRYAEFTQRSANEIVLPGVGFSGPLFNSAVHPTPKSFPAGNLLPQWVSAARDTLGENGVVWASIVVEFGFMENEALWLVDQFGEQLPQACMVNPTTQEIIGDLVAELADAGVDGVVLDVTDAFPNSSVPGRIGYTLHCFCEFCMEKLALKEFTEPRRLFVSDPLMSQLVLNTDESSGGVEHIDPPHEWIVSRDNSELIALAVARRFVPEDAEGLETAASKLLSYMRARIQVTAESIRDALASARTSSMRTAVILGDHKADLSQMVTLPALDIAKSADEYWLPFVPDRHILSGEWRAVQFLAGRSTYYFNAFFETVEKAPRNLVLGGVDDFLRGLLRASKGLMNNKLSGGAAYVANKLSQFEGCVGVPLAQDDHIEIIDKLTSAVTGDVLPPALLEKFRIETENRTTSSPEL